ncbi:MAG: ABC transporter permease subunit [Thiolinea sp.]
MLARRTGIRHVTAPISNRSTYQKRAISTIEGIQSGKKTRTLLFLASILLPLIVWQLIAEFKILPELLFKGPDDIFDFILFEDNSNNLHNALIIALLETITPALSGIAIAIIFSLVMAFITRLWTESYSYLSPLILFTQTMPLIALAPLLASWLGRGDALIIWIIISVTFFPAYSMLTQGMMQTPKTILDIVKVYGGKRWQQILYAEFPYSLPWLWSSLRLLVPRALTGAMTAEWTVTGTGLGNLLNQARGYLDFNLVWSIVLLATALSIILYYLPVSLEYGFYFIKKRAISDPNIISTFQKQ